MSKPLKLFIKSDCLKRKANDVIKTLNGDNLSEMRNYFNKNTTWLVPKFIVDQLGESIFNDVDSDKNKQASSNEIYHYLNDTFNLSQKELSNMTVEDAIIAIDKYLKEHPEVKSKF